MAEAHGYPLGLSDYREASDRRHREGIRENSKEDHGAAPGQHARCVPDPHSGLSRFTAHKNRK